MSFKTDVKETERAYLVEAELPGFQKDDIEISYADPYLTIKAVRKEDHSVEDTKQRDRPEGTPLWRVCAQILRAEHSRGPNCRFPEGWSP